MIVYLIEALAIAIAAYYIPQTVLSKTEIFKIALTGAISYLLLDLFSPIVSSGLRFGTGMSIGKNMINAKSPPSLFGNVVSKGGKNNNICLDECMANGTESEVCNIMCANGYEPLNLSGGYPLELSGGKINKAFCDENGIPPELCNEINDEQQGGVNCYKKNVL